MADEEQVLCMSIHFYQNDHNFSAFSGWNRTQYRFLNPWCPLTVVIFSFRWRWNVLGSIFIASHLWQLNVFVGCQMFFLYILQQVRQLEILCTRLYEATDAVQRAEAEKTLVQFQNAPDTLNKCQLLLQRGDSPYSQLLAATTLTKLVTRNSQSISLQQRVDMSKCFQQFWTQYGKFPSTMPDALPFHPPTPMTVLNSMHEKLCWIYWVCVRKLFCWLFFS